MRPRRALLYMPGDDRRKIEKAAAMQLDSVCMDLEDGVAPDNKLAARETVVAALREIDFGATERLVRVNPIGSGLADDDLAAVLPAKPNGIVIPKVNTPAEVQLAARKVVTHKAQDVRLLALIETARGIVNLSAIAAASPRLAALLFGAEDLASDLGARRTPAAREMLYARSAVVTHAAANELQAIDMVLVDFRNLERLAVEASEGADLGFDGKQAIHPDQIAPIHAAFTPTAAEVAHAQRIVAAHIAHAAEGRGAFALDGQMIDRPLVRAAENTLARARAAGIEI